MKIEILYTKISGIKTVRFSFGNKEFNFADGEKITAKKILWFVQFLLSALE